MSIVPSTLYRVKTFEAIRKLQQVDNGQLVLEATPTLEDMIDAWVTRTNNLIVETGPISLYCFPVAAQIEEHKLLAVIYIPAMEQGNDRYYGQHSRSVQSDVAAKPIRVPDVTSHTPKGPEADVPGATGTAKPAAEPASIAVPPGEATSSGTVLGGGLRIPKLEG